MREVGAGILLIGTLFIGLAAVGVVRYPDPYLRMQALSKASTLGLLLVLTGTAVAVPITDVITRAILTIVFLFITSPISAHLLARAAHRTGVMTCSTTKIDELEAHERSPDQ